MDKALNRKTSTFVLAGSMWWVVGEQPGYGSRYVAHVYGYDLYAVV